MKKVFIILIIVLPIYLINQANYFNDKNGKNDPKQNNIQINAISANSTSFIEKPVENDFYSQNNQKTILTNDESKSIQNEYKNESTEDLNSDVQDQINLNVEEKIFNEFKKSKKINNFSNDLKQFFGTFSGKFVHNKNEFEHDAYLNLFCDKNLKENVFTLFFTRKDGSQYHKIYVKGEGIYNYFYKSQVRPIIFIKLNEIEFVIFDDFSLNEIKGKYFTDYPSNIGNIILHKHK